MPSWRPWAVLALLFGVNLLNYIDRYVLAGVLPLIEEAFAGISKQRLGWLAPAFLVIYMATSPIFGFLGDRVRRKILVGIGVQLWSLATAAAGLARTYWQLFFSRMFVGIGEAAYATTAPTIISDIYPKSARGRAMAYFYVAIPVGSALGYLIGGTVGEAWSWRAAFYVVGLPGLLIGLAAYVMPEPVRGASEGVDAKDLERFLRRKVLIGDYVGILRIRSYLLNTLGMTAYTYAVGGIAYWMPTFLHQERDLGLAYANFWFGLVTVCTGIVGTLAGGSLADHLAKRIRGAYFLVCGVTMALAFPAFLVAVTSTAPRVYWSALAVTELLLFMNTGPSNTILVNVTLPNIRTSAFALNIFIIHALGDVFSPVIMGKVADQSDLATAFLTTAGVVLLSGLLWSAGTPFLHADTERVKTQMEQPDSD